MLLYLPAKGLYEKIDATVMSVKNIQAEFSIDRRCVNEAAA